MKKVTLYAISRCSLTEAKTESFTDNLCTIVAKKSQVSDYMKNMMIVKNFSHYKAWVENHYSDSKDTPEIREVYLNTVIDKSEYENYIIKKIVYTPDTIASMFRILNCCTPVGAAYETQAEVETLTKLLLNVLEPKKDIVDFKA